MSGEIQEKKRPPPRIVVGDMVFSVSEMLERAVAYCKNKVEHVNLVWDPSCSKELDMELVQGPCVPEVSMERGGREGRLAGELEVSKPKKVCAEGNQ